MPPHPKPWVLPPGADINNKQQCARTGPLMIAAAFQDLIGRYMPDLLHHLEGVAQNKGVKTRELTSLDLHNLVWAVGKLTRSLDELPEIFRAQNRPGGGGEQVEPEAEPEHIEGLTEELVSKLGQYINRE